MSELPEVFPRVPECAICGLRITENKHGEIDGKPIHASCPVQPNVTDADLHPALLKTMQNEVFFFKRLNEQRGGQQFTGPLIRAAAVLLFTPHIRVYLERHDTQALEQLRAAMGFDDPPSRRGPEVIQ